MIKWPDLQTVIAYALLVMLAAALFTLLFVPMPMTEAAGTLLTAILGMLVAKVGTMVDFYFGSSQPSKDKDATIASLVKNGKPNGKH